MSWGIALYDQTGALAEDTQHISLISFEGWYANPGDYTVPPTAHIFADFVSSDSLVPTLIGPTTLRLTLSATGLSNDIYVIGFA